MSDAALPRFPSQPGATHAPAYEPGVVEVQFREGSLPQIGGPAANAPTHVRAQNGLAFHGFNDIVQKYGVSAITPTFRTPHHEVAAAMATALTQGIDAPHLGNFVTVVFPETVDVHSVAAELEKLPEVERAVPVPKALPPSVVPPPRAGAPPSASPFTDPLVGTSDQAVVNPATGLENQWYLYRIRATNAWAFATGKNVVIADIDWGCRTSHQDLSAQIDAAHTYNAYDGGNDVTHGSSVFHGTGVLGLAGAAANGVGMAGVAYEATLWPIQSDSGPGPALPGNAWANAIEWVRTANSGGRRKIVNLEVQTGAFGNYEELPSVNAAIKLAIGNGVVVCVAAGNGDRDATISDAGKPIPPTGSILVGATGYDPAKNARAWFSNFGSTVVVSAPGDTSHDVTCDSASDTAYRNDFGGTSGATPKVSGAVALLLSVDPTLTHAQVRSILNATGSAVQTEPGKPVGTFLNVEAAVHRAQPQPKTMAIHSVQFPNADLRMDGRGVTQPVAAGGGVVNCQFGVGPWEKFQLVPQPDGTVAIGSVQYPNVFLRMDGRGVTHAVAAGGGVVNCQFTVGPWEKFHLVTQPDGTVAIGSVQFPNVFLRLDGTGVTQPNANGSGVVNCQFGVGPWEKFVLVPV
ncbi:MAG: hypothetical protein JWM87_4840 [Candidatus Eremiobacteraeota bacterium]|nr:hypothetical protein [Candidatus Eremiobacteraeota bacterium]